MPDFLSVAFQSSLTTEGILFAAFGFLYAAYCQFSSLPTPIDPLRAPAANQLARACRITSKLIALNAVLVIYPLVRTTIFTNIENILISIGFVVTVIIIAYISWTLASTM